MLLFECFDTLHNEINEYRSMMWSLWIIYTFCLNILNHKQTQILTVHPTSLGRKTRVTRHLLTKRRAEWFLRYKHCFSPWWSWLYSQRNSDSIRFTFYL